MQTLAQYRATNEVDITMPKLTRAWYNKVFLSVAMPALVHDRFGMPTALPKNTGEQVLWRRWKKLPPNVVPLSESVTPAGKNMAYENVLGTVYWYGDWVGITDVVKWMHPDPVLSITTKRLAEQAAETADILTRDIINAGTSFLRVAAGATILTARVNTADVIHPAQLKTAITMLEGADAKYFHPTMNASRKIATEPIGPSYVAIVHPHVAHDLPDELGAEWIPREKYAAGNVAYPTEIGKYRNIRFLTSTLAKVWPDSGAAATSGPTAASVFRATSATDTAADVYSCLILAKEAYGVVKLKGAAATYYNPAGGNSDPLHQRATAGWKMCKGAAILNDAYMVRIECLAKW